METNPLDVLRETAVETIPPGMLATPQSILVYPNEILKKISMPVIDFGADSLKSLFADLEATMQNRGIGISAIQIGSPLRAIVVTGNDGKRVCACNPEIVEITPEKIGIREGCLSFPGLFVVVWRPEEVTVRYRTPIGEERTISAVGTEARCWVHEIEHLDGILFIDRLSAFNRKTALVQWSKIARKLK